MLIQESIDEEAAKAAGVSEEEIKEILKEEKPVKKEKAEVKVKEEAVKETVQEEAK